MKVSLSWLKEYLDLTISPEQIAETLTLAGLEVDKVHVIAPAFEGVVVAKIESLQPHPNADKLRIATVFDGVERFQVVCGDLTCKEGQITAFAKIGAVLKDESGKDWKIKKGKLRDVESFGMLCSENELGLSDVGEGIMAFSEEIPLNTDVKSLYADVIFEISLTPNLGHCMSVLGIARELAALLQLKLKRPAFSVKENDKSFIEDFVSVEIQDKEHCSKYCCRLAQNVKVGPSPFWLKSRLEACGVRSINNIVDIGNYVMMELGQPLHMFDYDTLSGKKIIVASKTPYSSLVTLDDKERTIPEGCLLICDQDKPLAVAGVMGGKSSAVSDATRSILIESAAFSPQAVRKASKLLNLRTDGSGRFEKGTDQENVKIALDRAASLIQELAGGSIVKGTAERIAVPLAPRTILCRIARVNRILGTFLSVREVVEIFERLEIKVISEKSDELHVQPPSYRNDLLIETDLIEEVGRLYGFNNIEKKAPLHVSSKLTHAPFYILETDVRTKLISEGLQEWLTCDLISPMLAELTLEKSLPKDTLIHVLHPSSIDQSVLRATLLPGMLQIVKLNLDHQNSDMSAFEVGRIHFKNGANYEEPSSAGIILTGKASAYHFDPKPKDVDFFDLKGHVENLLEALNVQNAVFEVSHLHNFHPGRQARVKVNGIVLGALGEVHPQHLKVLDIDQKVYFAEINLHELSLIQRKGIKVADLPLYPASERDWTISLKDEIPLSHVMQVIKEVKSPLLEKMFLLDIYKSEQLGKEKKNVTLRFIYRDLEKTIAFESVEKEHTKLLEQVAEKLRDCLL